MSQQDQMGKDDQDIDYDELDMPPSRFSMMTGTLVGIGAITLAIFTGVIWYAYNAGTEQAKQDGLPIAQAEQGETKVKPSDPGGASFAHQDKTVYDKIDGNEGSVEQLLPGAEEPQEKPQIISPYNNEMPAEGQPKVLRIPPPAAGDKPIVPSEAPAISAPAIADPMGRQDSARSDGEDVAAEPAPEVTTSPQQAPGSTQDQIALDAVAAKAMKQPVVEELVEEPAAEPVKPAPVVASGKSYVLQLGAFRTEEAADAGWKLLATRHAAVLGELERFIVPADLGDKGKFFRLQAGPFAERAAANAQCASLKTAGVDCLVAAR